MSLDLSGLNKVSSLLSEDHAAEGGKPLLLEIDLVEEDPEQPRQVFDPTALDELAESIKSRGVKTPISVRPHPEKDGCYLVNHGARRLKASIMAGQTEIPAFVDADHGFVDQLVENIQREALTLKETIEGVGRLLSEGKKQKEIAALTGKSKGWVSGYAKLLKVPEIVKEALETGLCTDATVLGALSDHHKEAPEIVEPFIKRKLANEEVITRAGLKELVALIDEDNQVGTEAGGVPQDPYATVGETLDNVMPESDGGNFDETEEPASYTSDDTGDDTLATPVTPRAPSVKPEIQVRVDGREGVLLTKKQSTYGLVWVEYEDGSEAQISALNVELIAVVDLNEK